MKQIFLGLSYTFTIILIILMLAFAAFAAGPPFAKGDILAYQGPTCSEEGHREMVGLVFPLYETGVDEGLSEKQFLRVVKLLEDGICWITDSDSVFAITQVKLEIKTKHGELWTIGILSADFAESFIPWSSLGPRPERVDYHEV